MGFVRAMNVKKPSPHHEGCLLTSKGIVNVVYLASDRVFLYMKERIRKSLAEDRYLRKNNNNNTIRIYCPLKINIIIIIIIKN